MMTVLIIEDEVKTARELTKLIEGLDDGARVVGMLSGVRSSIQWLADNPMPDLIFSDIQLGDGLSFDIFRQVQLDVPVIFCTAFDEYAIQAFQANGIDYLLKPVDEDRLAQSLEKYKRLRGGFGKRLAGLAEQMDVRYKNTLLVYVREKIIPVRVTEIVYIHAANGLTYIATAAGHEYATQYSMDELEAMLYPDRFFRANRQFIVHREQVRAVEHYFSRRLLVKLHCETPENIIVSKLKASEFLQWMER